MKSLAILLCGLAATIQAATIYDSGIPASHASAALGGGHYCTLQEMPSSFCVSWNAVQVAFSEPTTITEAAFYIRSENLGYPTEQGTIRAVVYSSLADPELYSAEFVMRAGQLGWRGATGLDWALEAGSYWIALQVDESSRFTGGWHYDAPHASQSGATYYGTPVSTWREIPDPYASFGLRLEGTTADTHDLNRDGLISLDDLNALSAGMIAGSTDVFYDVDRDGTVQQADWVSLHSRLTLITGDVTQDEKFDSSDIVKLFMAGKYEDLIDNNTYWVEGDFDGDLDFTTSDLILAFGEGRYEATSLAIPVPEPSALVLFAMGCLLTGVRQKRSGE